MTVSVLVPGSSCFVLAAHGLAAENGSLSDSKLETAEAKVTAKRCLAE
jgi:hypothetical protein